MLKYRCMDFKHLRWVDKVSIPWFFVLDKQNNKFSDSDDHIMFTIYLENDIFGFGLFTSSICLTFDNWPTWKKSDHHNIYTKPLQSSLNIYKDYQNCQEFSEDLLLWNQLIAQTIVPLSVYCDSKKTWFS